MKLFEYNPQTYKGTQVDLPLDFIYKQLETQQKEFDAQTAAVDKASENFLKIDPGMLTEEAYQRVMQNYLPRLEKIRDDLYNTGNVGMAAPALSKFTTDLASDFEVKNILRDAKLTETYRQGLQQGLYKDMIFPGLHKPDGKTRRQLGLNEATSPDLYAPMPFVDPMSDLAEEADKYVKAIERDNPAEFRTTKDGRIITTQEGIKERKFEKIMDYFVGRFPSYYKDPSKQGYFYQATGFNPQNYTIGMWTELLTPVARALAFENRSIETSVTSGQTPSLSDPKSTLNPDNNNKTKAQGLVHPITTNVSTENSGIPAWNTAEYPEGITSFADFEEDLQQNNDDLGLAYDAIYNLSGGEIDEEKGTPAASNWINENYINENGFWKVKPGSSAPPVNKSVSDALNTFTNATYSLRNRLSLFEELQEATDVKSYNPQVIKNANLVGQKYILNEFTGGVDPVGGFKLFFNSLKDPLSSPYKLARINHSDDEIKEAILEYDKIVLNELKGKPEGKIYQAFENYKNRISQMTLMGLKDDDKVNSMEGQLINNVLGGHISARSLLTGEKLDKGDLDETFTEYIPYKDGDPSKGVDYSQVQTSIGLHPKYGVVGVMSMNGRSFTIDLKDANIDQIFTDENPHYKQQIQVFQQVADSFKRSGTNEGSFKIGNTQFVFEVESENIGGTNPQFYYSEKFDGTNTQSHQNLGTIFTRAYEIADNNNKAFDILLQVKKEELLQQYNDEFNRLGLYDTDGATKLKKKYEQKLLDLEEQLKTEFSAPKTVGGSSSGKATPQPGGPLGLGR
jgi:hypothetical protein